MSADESHTGRCLCGEVVFSFSGPPRFISNCWCESCRRAHGATSVAWVGVLDDAFSCSSNSLTWYTSSAQSKRAFCATCGTRLLFKSDLWPGETHMVLACLDTPHNLKVTGISFADEKPDWAGNF